MKIIQTTYKDRPALCVHGARLTATFLPEDGGKLVSLCGDGRELLQQREGAAYRRLFPDSDYVQAECSGFDDMFPTIDPYTPQDGPFRGVTYPDHGEVCRHPVECETAGGSLRFTFHSKRFPIRFTKTVTEEGSGGIAIDYDIANDGNDAFPCLWAAHCMLNAFPDAKIVTPFAPDAPIRTMFGKQLSRERTLPRKADGENYKFFYTDPMPDGWCGYRYADGKTLMLRFPKETVKYLGVWINNGSFEDMYNIALEPCTAPYDRPDAAEQSGCACEIAANSALRFRLTLDMEQKEGTSND